MNGLRYSLTGRVSLILVIAVVFLISNANAAPDKPQLSALYQLEDAFTSIVDKVVPSVVSVTSTTTVESGQMSPWFGDDFLKGFPFFGPQ